MIYTVTLNPSLDYIVDVENLTVGAINRSTKEAIYPGGKGINVSIILSRLGAETNGNWLQSGLYRGKPGAPCPKRRHQGSASFG